MLATKLKELRDGANLSTAEWSKLSNIPVETINKILQGRTASPGFDTITALVVAAGGSLDELAEISKAVITREIEKQGGNTDQFEILTKSYEDRIAHLSSMVESLHKERDTVHEEHRAELVRMSEHDSAVLDRFRESSDRIIAAKDAQLKVLQGILIAMAVALVATLVGLTAHVFYDVMSGML